MAHTEWNAVTDSLGDILLLIQKNMFFFSLARENIGVNTEEVYEQYSNNLKVKSKNYLMYHT